MKTFEDLEFKPHRHMPGLQAIMYFPNGYGVSVVRFKLMLDSSMYGSYTSNEKEWEVAILKDGKLCYTTPLTDDVIGHQTDSEVTEIMRQVQMFEK